MRKRIAEAEMLIGEAPFLARIGEGLFTLICLATRLSPIEAEILRASLAGLLLSLAFACRGVWKAAEVRLIWHRRE